MIFMICFRFVFLVFVGSALRSGCNRRCYLIWMLVGVVAVLVGSCDQFPGCCSRVWFVFSTSPSRSNNCWTFDRAHARGAKHSSLTICFGWPRQRPMGVPCVLVLRTFKSTFGIAIDYMLRSAVLWGGV